MSNSRVFSDQMYAAQRSGAGTIKRIRLENFMCHSSLEIELGQWVNFITGQNGSGKSAILTALCIAFGSRAKDTQRASKLKEFIKTGCSYANVQVELRNEGVDAFKPEIYGDTIFLERRISDSTSSTVLKDCQGRKVASRKDDLRELVEHFNIDVENPCVIMSQDKSREFLHSGNDKDKFKFFFKATLLQQVDELLRSIIKQLEDAYALVDELEKMIKPIEIELKQLDKKIKDIEHLEMMSKEAQLLRKKLAWSLVYDVDKQLQSQRGNIEMLKDRIPRCQAKIDSTLDKLEKLQENFSKKKVQITSLMERTSEVRRKERELKDALSLAKKEKLELSGELGRCTKQIEEKLNDVRDLEKQVHDIQEKHYRNSQVEESEKEKQIKEIEDAVNDMQSMVSRFEDEEKALSECQLAEEKAIEKIENEIKYYEAERRKIDNQIQELRLNQDNRVTAFGGDAVLRLLREIERNYRRFRMPPIGPIGAHVTLVNGDTWAPVVEQAIGRLLDAFIVTNSEDACTLRKCAREARYNYFPIVIHKFSRPRLTIPNNLLPQTNHPTTLSVLHSDNPTVYNVLVDSGKAERQVLVKDYNMGRAVAFDQRIPNVAEVFTLDGFKMFSRGSVQTILPVNKKFRKARLCSSFGDQIKESERHAADIRQNLEHCKNMKRESLKKCQDFEMRLNNVKKRRFIKEREVSAKKMKLQDLRNSRIVSTESATNELRQDISDAEIEIHEKKEFQERLRERLKEAEEKEGTLRLSLEDLGESTEGEIKAYEKAEGDLTDIENKICEEKKNKEHFENVKNKILAQIKEVETQYLAVEDSRKESYRKASVICPESEIEALGGLDGWTTNKLNAQLSNLNDRLKHESHRYSESIDDLRLLYEEKESRISRKLKTYKAFRERLNACQKALDLRWKTFQRNASLLRRELTWQFNGHLGNKGISGHINVDYDEKTLSVEVKMPQDASSATVRDTRGLSGGERSFSTLCFALALHEMTEAPFRAMDEFDVFMDAVSRKISLDTLVDFALGEGSQWIFITPHDTSTVKNGERIKKQQMAAPRS